MKTTYKDMFISFIFLYIYVFIIDKNLGDTWITLATICW
jgi:hypothetical protein